MHRFVFSAHLFAGLVSLLSNNVAHGAEHNLLFFTDAFATEHVSGKDIDDSSAAAVDLVYSYSTEKFRILGEYTLSTEESELERLQFGWQASDNTIFWLGRVHNIDNYWNTTFHHGQFLQTSISRPWVESFEDEGGPIASHTTGLLIETTKTISENSGFEIKFSAGVGPHFEEDLEPFDIFDPNQKHDLSMQTRIAFVPSMDRSNQIGLVASYSFIPVENTVSQTEPFDEIEQTVTGFYVDWAWGATRIISSVKNISNKFKPTNRREHFWSAYLYGAQELSEHFSIFARIDHTDGEKDSVYLNLLGEPIAGQASFGIRWDYRRRQALTFEIMNVDQFMSSDRTNLTLQWSAVFP